MQERNEVHVVMDDREPDHVRDVVQAAIEEEARSASFKASFEARRLDVGDYLINDLCIERKTVSDFISSIHDGRMENQLYQMSANYDVSFVMIAPDIKERGGLRGTLKKKAFTDAAVRGSPDDNGMRRFVAYTSFLSSTIASGLLKRSPVGRQGMVVVLPLDDHGMFLDVMRKLARYVAIPGVRTPRFVKKVSTLTMTEVMLSSIPGVGEHRARLIASEFPTIKMIADLDSPSPLTRVKGIGRKTAMTVWKAIREGEVT